MHVSFLYICLCTYSLNCNGWLFNILNRKLLLVFSVFLVCAKISQLNSYLYIHWMVMKGGGSGPGGGVWFGR